MEYPWLFMLASIACAAILVICSTAVVAKTAKLDAPKIDLTVDSYEDSKEPFGAVFKIHNDGICILSNISAAANYRTASAPLIINCVTAINPIPYLKPGRRSSLHFAGYPKELPFDPKTWVTIELHFKTAMIQRDTNATFGFVVKRDTTGNYSWYDVGEGQTVKEMRTAMNGIPLTGMNILPFLDVHVTRVEDISITNTAYPLKVSYTWQNIGGVPATAVYIEWKLWGISENGHRFGERYTNIWPLALSQQVLLPGMTNGNYTVYGGPLASKAFQPLMSGYMALVGDVQFKDLANHTYGMVIRAIRTNGQFEVRYLDMTDYYRELAPDFHMK
jgi:hypothetical protein